MEISELQISQVNKQIEALIKAESFYGKKLEEAGITRISTPEDFKKLPFSEKKDLSPRPEAILYGMCNSS